MKEEARRRERIMGSERRKEKGGGAEMIPRHFSFSFLFFSGVVGFLCDPDILSELGVREVTLEAK